MLTAPAEGTARATNRAEKTDILAAALASATRAVTTPVAMKWSSRGLRDGELPPDLTKNRTHLAIYLLPRAFASLNCPMASEFAELWLFGASRRRKLERIGRHYPKAPLLICRYDLNEFGGSATIKTVVSNILQAAIDTLPKMASAESIQDDRWQELRRIAKDTAARHKKKDQWSESTPSFINVLEYPEIRVENRGITTDTYITHGESPLQSDAYGAIGECAVRAYLEAVISKKPGDDRIFVRPTRVGVRVWDDYNFTDTPGSTMGKLLSRVLGRQASQFLGFWQDTDGDDVILLQNSDFRSFRETFMPAYNNLVPPPEKKLTCEDYSSASNFVTRMIQGDAEYPLHSMTV